MDYDKLIERFNADTKDWAGDGYIKRDLQNAVLAIETLRLENEAMAMQLNEFSEFLCHMTGNLLSKTNYTAQAMISAAEDYQQRVCDNDCDLRADLARVTAERDGAVEDISSVLANAEEIRRGYGVDNADADAAFADLCGNYCAKCGNNCYEEAEDYRCKNFKWRGIKEDI